MKKQKNRLEFYQVTTKGKREWRWRIYRQGRKIAASSEGYQNKKAMFKNLRSISNMLLPPKFV